MTPAPALEVTAGTVVCALPGWSNDAAADDEASCLAKGFGALRLTCDRLLLRGGQVGSGHERSMLCFRLWANVTTIQDRCNLDIESAILKQDNLQSGQPDSLELRTEQGSGFVGRPVDLLAVQCSYNIERHGGFQKQSTHR